MRINGFLNAAELRACRAVLGWTQLKLAQRAGFNVRTVKYHEAKRGRVDGVAPGRFRDLFESAGLRLSPLPERRIEPNPGLWVRVQLSDQVLPSRTPSMKPTKPLKRQCGAKTRKGNPCVAQPIPGSNRCKNHGGLSTGPKTAEGRARIAEAQRARQVGPGSGPHVDHQ